MLPERAPGYHVLGEGEAFDVSDCVCRAGCHSPVVEGAHARVCVSVVLSGAFHARGPEGDAVVGPGSLLLGNRAAPYEFRHVVDGGDRSLVIEYSDTMLDEALLGSRAEDTRPFARTSVPGSLGSLEAVLLARQALAPGDAEELREVVLSVLDVALRLGGAPAETRVELSERQARSVARVLRYLEDHVSDDCSLETLASIAGLTRFHFLRVFRAVTGQTPRQWVIAMRLRLAANLLRASRTRVTDIALESGFGDLSHFTMSFTRAFGISPRAYRVRALERG
ncbi:helix-turn-helix domain-containing protein [Myxococcus faecalis]|uniref:helix-turn-helix domain-containing protein n=1 Tax=Myxococcus faecalis TaxID=3115646 RepID=UPI003CEA52D9